MTKPALDGEATNPSKDSGDRRSNDTIATVSDSVGEVAGREHQFRVRVTKDHLVFSAAHFVTIGEFCERLHGHNWRVGAVVEGALDENTFVVDFIALRDILQQIVLELDHQMLLPTRHRAIRVKELSATEVEVRYDSRRWVFPAEDCRLLPMDQTTAERLAEWIDARVHAALTAGGSQLLTAIEIEVEENFGQSAFCRRNLSSSLTATTACPLTGDGLLIGDGCLSATDGCISHLADGRRIVPIERVVEIVRVSLSNEEREARFQTILNHKGHEVHEVRSDRSLAP